MDEQKREINKQNEKINKKTDEQNQKMEGTLKASIAENDERFQRI